MEVKAKSKGKYGKQRSNKGGDVNTQPSIAYNIGGRYGRCCRNHCIRQLLVIISGFQDTNRKAIATKTRGVILTICMRFDSTL